MSVKIISESHLDHGIPSEVVQYVLAMCAAMTGFFIKTIKIPVEMGKVPCSLEGPATGCEAVTENEVFWAHRGERKYVSRLVWGQKVMVDEVTIIAGPHNDEQCVLYTMFGGPCAPKEVQDPTLKDEERGDALEFWRQHAIKVNNDDDVRCPGCGRRLYESTWSSPCCWDN